MAQNLTSRHIDSLRAVIAPSDVVPDVDPPHRHHANACSIDVLNDDEAARIEALRAIKLLDTPPESVFDTIVAIAREKTGCKSALISLVDVDRQWFKARSGIALTQTPREQSFCAHAIKSADVMIVKDATADPRFHDNPLVTGSPHIKLYVGVPLSVKSPVGSHQQHVRIGTLCVLDPVSRDVGAEEITELRALAAIVESLFEARAHAVLALTLVEAQIVTTQRLEKNNRQFKQAERMANVGSWSLNLATKRASWSEQVYAIHGLPVGSDTDLVDALSFYPPHARAVVADALERVVATGESFDLEVDFVNAQGRRMRVRTMGELELQNGHPSAIIGVFQDVSRQSELEQKLRDLALTDPLTGMPNRACLDDYLDAHIVRAGDGPIALMILDLDGFKTVNDRFGHLAGDEVLQHVADQLSGPGMGGNFAARLGGDEFVVVVVDPLLIKNIGDFGRKVLEHIRHTIDHDGEQIAISASIGISTMAGGSHDRRELMRRADVALYSAKHDGRNCVRLARTDNAKSSARRAA